MNDGLKFKLMNEINCILITSNHNYSLETRREFNDYIKNHCKHLSALVVDFWKTGLLAVNRTYGGVDTTKKFWNEFFRLEKQLEEKKQVD